VCCANGDMQPPGLLPLLLTLLQAKGGAGRRSSSAPAQLKPAAPPPLPMHVGSCPHSLCSVREPHKPCTLTAGQDAAWSRAGQLRSLRAPWTAACAEPLGASRSVLPPTASGRGAATAVAGADRSAARSAVVGVQQPGAPSGRTAGSSCARSSAGGSACDPRPQPQLEWAAAGLKRCEASLDATVRDDGAGELLRLGWAEDVRMPLLLLVLQVVATGLASTLGAAPWEPAWPVTAMGSCEDCARWED
jgi:hypothetical protein